MGNILSLSVSAHIFSYFSTLYSVNELQPKVEHIALLIPLCYSCQESTYLRLCHEKALYLAPSKMAYIESHKMPCEGMDTKWLRTSLRVCLERSMYVRRHSSLFWRDLHAREGTSLQSCYIRSYSFPHAGKSTCRASWKAWALVYVRAKRDKFATSFLCILRTSLLVPIEKVYLM